MPRKTAAKTPPFSKVKRPPVWRRRKSEQGAIAILTAVTIVVMIAMLGLALDLGRTYNRKTELQSIADAAALAAVNALDGTPAGIDKAATAAATVAATFSYSYNNAFVAWSPNALKFSTSPDGGSTGWMEGTAAKAVAEKTFFARVDTSVFDTDPGLIANVLIPVVSSALAETKLSSVAVAGRDSLNVLPLAICANSNTPASALPSGELVEYGFRRGIGYDLMQLNPAGGTPENFLVNPIAPAGTLGASVMDKMDIISMYICTGKMAIPGLQGGVTVERYFPLGSMYPHLNTRFGTYSPPCNASSAPADPNTRRFDQASATWIRTQPPGLSAGPLWSYAKAAKYASYTTNRGVEPPNGYATFSATSADWAALYPGPPAANPQSYPTATPYQNTGGAAAYKTIYNTRVLRVPLLECPVTSGSKVTATVLGIGKFFMTVPATSSTLYAEFAGMEPWTAIGGNARLYR